MSEVLFHVTMGYWDDLTDPKIQAFLKVRPDGIGFDMIARVCTFLEYKRPMDSRDGASEQPDWYTGPDWSLDWAQDKDLERHQIRSTPRVYQVGVEETGNDLDRCPIQLHSRSPRLHYRDCMGVPAHQARGQQRKDTRRHSTTGHS